MLLCKTLPDCSDGAVKIAGCARGALDASTSRQLSARDCIRSLTARMFAVSGLQQTSVVLQLCSLHPNSILAYTLGRLIVVMCYFKFMWYGICGILRLLFLYEVPLLYGVLYLLCC